MILAIEEVAVVASTERYDEDYDARVGNHNFIIITFMTCCYMSLHGKGGDGQPPFSYRRRNL